MASWLKEELEAIATGDDLHIAPFREDGETYGTPTWIWSVRGRRRSVRPGLQRQVVPLVPIRAGAKGRADHRLRDDLERWRFEPVDGPLNDRIDDAYRAKYDGSPYLAPMIGERARSATVRVVPRSECPDPKVMLL